MSFTSEVISFLDKNRVFRVIALALAISINSNRNHFRNLRVGVGRYFNGVGGRVRIRLRAYDNFDNCHPGRGYFTSRQTMRSLKSALLLYLADVKKAQGEFSEAEEIFLKLSFNDVAAYEALCSLGDLMLTQAQWADEFRTFLSEGLIIDPRDQIDHGTCIWHNRTYEEAIKVLQSAVSINKNDERAYWLLALSCIGAGEVTEALRVVDKLKQFFPSDSSHLGHLRMKALFHIEPDETAAAAIEQFKGWRDNHGKYWTAYNANLRIASDLPNDDCFKFQKLGEKSQVNIASTLVFEGKTSQQTSSVIFDPPYVCTLKNATILPINGLVMTQSRTILEDSSHHPKIHLDVFAPNVRSVSNQSALVCMPEPDEHTYEDCVYIGNNANYYHWLLEDLPRLSILKDASMLDGRSVLVDQTIRNWQIELLELFGISASRLRKVDFTSPVRLPEFIAPSLLSRSSMAHPKAVQFIRETLLKNYQNPHPKAGKRLYVSRRSVPGRQMLNSVEISKLFQRAGFQLVDPGRLGIREQIELFHDAEIIAGPAGAGLTNLVFAPPGARLIHFGPLDIAGHTFTSIANIIGQRSYLCVGRGHARTYHRWIWTNFDFTIDSRDARIALDIALN